MKCMYCGGEMEWTRSTYTIDRDGHHLFIKDVAAYICSQCGEKHFQESEVAEVLTGAEERRCGGAEAQRSRNRAREQRCRGEREPG